MGDDSDSEGTCPTPTSPTSSPGFQSGSGDDLVKYVEAAVLTCATANVEAVKIILRRLSEAAEDEVTRLVEELCGLFERFNFRQVTMIKQALSLFLAGETLDVHGIDKVCEDVEFQEGIQRVLSYLPGKPSSPASTDVAGEAATQGAAISLQRDGDASSILSAAVESTSPGELRVQTVNTSSSPGTGIAETSSATVQSLSRTRKAQDRERNWSESWKRAVRGVLKKHHRERIRDKALRRMQAGPRRIIPKSDATKERLRKILGDNFLFGDLEAALREEIIDAFQDVRIAPGTEIIKQGDVADNFYIIDVGEIDILAKKGNEPPTLLRSKGAGESFGELALMYDNVRNATCQATTYTLLWAVNRATFKSIMGRHLTGSPTAQVLREAPVLKKLSTREIVNLSTQCSITTFQRGQTVLPAGVTMDKVYLIQDGQVRVSRGASRETVAVMNRLEVLGEALLLNAEGVNQWNYVASSEHVTIIIMDRTLLTSEILDNMRKGLQTQHVTLALQRVPAFLELSFQKHARLAEAFIETCHLNGQHIINPGEALGSAARIYVVQSGVISLSRIPVEGAFTKDVSRPRESAGSAVVSGWGSRFGSLLKSTGPGSTPHSPRGSVMAPESLSNPQLGASKLSKAADTKSSVPELKIDLVGEKTPMINRPGGSPRQYTGSSVPWTITTYGVFGDECLLNATKDDSDGPISQAGACVESSGAVCLSISLSEVTAIIGPIQELIMRTVNLKVLRKVRCLECLTASELDVLSRSMGIRKLKPGEMIYRTSDPADRLYVIRKGTVHEIKEAGGRGSIRGADQVVLSKGSSFGEEALLGQGPRSSTMIAGDAAVGGLGAELVYLDRAVLETNFGPLQELAEQRRKENELKGIVKTIVFEDLEVVGLLGTGLFGKVKLVYSKPTKEYYAMKCVNKARVVKMQEEEHLRNEKMYMAELDHPFITRLVRTFKDTTHVYLLQELTTGRELFLFMEKIGRLQEWEAAFYAGGVLLALEYMHSKGIVYRDLKPENTLIGDNGYPKLIDMGFAKKIYSRRTYSMCGTPDYMAPEIIKRQGHGKAVDYWALGCMIFEMITNTSPFNRGDDAPQVVFQRITEGRFRFPPYMSSNAVDIIKKLLDPNPETRLGCRKRGALDIKEHPFFTDLINFQLLIRQKEDPPMIPPRIVDYLTLCIHDDGEVDPPILNSNPIDKNWDDIF